MKQIQAIFGAGVLTGSLSVLLFGSSLLAQAAGQHVGQPVQRPVQATAKPVQTAKPVVPTPSPRPSQAQPCGTAVPAAAAEQFLILVPFENHLKNQDPAISDMALDTLQISLLKPENKLFRLIGRKHVKAILAELAFSENALSDPQKALKLGKLLSADLMLTGTVSAGKIHTSEVTNLQPIEYTWATAEVSTTLIRIETGEVLFASKASGISARYPTWQGDTYTSIILEAVEQASSQLVGELIASQKPLTEARK
ncbi:MAG: CsgG/HfaB family protein [Candidatus Sericytochromatia bacterium]